MFYDSELKALKSYSLFRNRVAYDEQLIDLASNDYLSLSGNKELFDKAVERVKSYVHHAPRASQLVNGYHPIHREFEEYLVSTNSFEDAIVVGSGFLANIALLEALPRKGDLLLLDEEYHASGILASKLTGARVEFFKHNSSKELEKLLKKSSYKRAVVAVEGIYSMSGGLLDREIFEVADRYGAILVVDEAHSSGVVGENFLGVFDLFGITPKANHIKMGTLGKAIGSYGSYILASSEIVEFLQNRAKSIVYATAPSLFDVALAHESMKFIDANREAFVKKREMVQKVVLEIFGKRVDGLVLNIDIADNQKVLEIKERLLSEGIIVGAIRPPTVKRAILRVILNLGVEEIESSLMKIREVASEL